MRSGLLILSLVLLGMSSCKKDKLEDERVILSGKWHWFYTEHTYGWCQNSPKFQTIFASNTTTTCMVDLSEKGKVSFIENGSTKEKQRLVFEYFEADNQGGYFFYIRLNNKQDEILEGSISADTLRLSRFPYDEDDPNCENYLNFFVRE